MKTTAACAFLTLAFKAWSNPWLPPLPQNEGAVTFQLQNSDDVHGWSPDTTPIILPRLNALEIVGSGSEQNPFESGKISLSGLSVADEDELAQKAAQWIGNPLTEQGLDRLTELILKHYETHDLPMNEVFVPPQDAEGGKLIINVDEGLVGQVGISKTKHFNNNILNKGIHLTRGQLLRSSSIQRDLDWLSRNPFRKTNLLVSPGQGISADLLLEINEVKPWRTFAGYDNSGTETAGENRWFAGFNWGNGFGQDHLLSYRFTTGDSTDDFTAHTFTWEIPLPSQHSWLQLTAALADVEATDDRFGLRTFSEGSSWMVGLSYGLQLDRWRGWQQDASFGMQFKRADNFVLFGDDVIPKTTVDLFQFQATWNGNGPLWAGNAKAYANLVFSPGHIGGNNGTDEFSAFRFDADPTYAYLRLGGSWERTIPKDWEVHLRATAQLASGALLPTEQLGLGGQRTVRGYEELIYLADNGYALSAEIHTPNLTFGETTLSAHAFLDHGLGWREHEDSQTLTSLGLGLSLTHSHVLSANLSAGQALTSPNDITVHAGILMSF